MSKKKKKKKNYIELKKVERKRGRGTFKSTQTESRAESKHHIEDPQPFFKRVWQIHTKRSHKATIIAP